MWIFWIREKSLVPTGIRTPGRPAWSHVAILTMLLRLPLNVDAVYTGRNLPIFVKFLRNVNKFSTSLHGVTSYKTVILFYWLSYSLSQMCKRRRRANGSNRLSSRQRARLVFRRRFVLIFVLFWLTFSWFSSVPPAKCQDNASSKSTPVSFQFTFQQLLYHLAHHKRPRKNSQFSLNGTVSSENLDQFLANVHIAWKCGWIDKHRRYALFHPELLVF